MDEPGAALDARRAPSALEVAAVRLWAPATAAAARGKLLAPAEAERLLGMPDLDAVDMACNALQRWCWLRGLPPVDRVVAHARTRDPFRLVVDYEVFYEAMGVDVATERMVMAYPWAKVRPPEPEELAWADGHVLARGGLVRSFRRADLELDLKEADAAKGRRRPFPEGFAGWDGVHREHEAVLAQLGRAGLALADLRPPGRAPYPPPKPRASQWVD